MVGQAVRFNVDKAFPSRSFKGVVKQIRLNPTTQQNEVTYNVVISVDNPDQILLPGMTSYVSIVVARREDALLVPNAALRFKPDPKDGEKNGEKREDRAAEGKKPDKKRDAHTFISERFPLEKAIGPELNANEIYGNLTVFQDSQQIRNLQPLCERPDAAAEIEHDPCPRVDAGCR